MNRGKQLIQMDGRTGTERMAKWQILLRATEYRKLWSPMIVCVLKRYSTLKKKRRLVALLILANILNLFSIYMRNTILFKHFFAMQWTFWIVISVLRVGSRWGVNKYLHTKISSHHFPRGSQMIFNEGRHTQP